MSSLFISYRRADSPGSVSRLHDRLKTRLPRWMLFYDHQNLKPGEDFPERLRQEATSATVVLIAIGPRWVGSLKERLNQSGVDHVREEVRLALQAGHKVVPVLVENTSMPSEADLADFPDLLPLLRLNGRVVRPDPDFETDLERLAAFLDELGPGVGAGTLLGGKYKILRAIGQGGMGVVFEAEQIEPSRTVAIKMILEGMDTKEVLARFDGEKEALARMDHPNIARVIDSGASPSGKPYFVMEFVKGEPITCYCDRKKMSPNDRLELFRLVCSAVQHAHQKGIIHRDIKPSNVLVEEIDGKPVPKVIDFGLAKALAGKLTDKTLVSESGKTVGTLIYSSPEQAAGRTYDIDTRTDIYSLGVLLYELLAGEPPFTEEHLKDAGDEAMRREIIDGDMSKPSTKLSSSNRLPTIAANRQLDPTKLTRLVRGELDWIVMRALEKEVRRRYDTANGLAMDIQRYLTDEPVEAGPPSAGYRLRKFVRRHRGPVVAGLLVLLVLTAGIVGTTYGLFEARASERLAKQETERAESALRAESIALAEAETNRKIALDNERRAVKSEKLAKERLARIEKGVGAAVGEATLPQSAEAIDAFMLKLAALAKATNFNDAKAITERDPSFAKRAEELKTILEANLKDEKAIRAMLKPSSVPSLIIMIKDSDRQVRLKAAQLLRIMGRDAKAAIPALIEAFKDPDVFVRSAAITAVGTMGPDALPALPALREALRDEEFLGAVAAAAAVTIGQLGESAKPAVPDLIALLPRRGKEGTLLGTLGSLGALKNLGPVAAEAIPAVIETLSESSDSTIRAQCLRVLVKAGPAATPALPELIQILKGTDLNLQALASEVLCSCPAVAGKALPELIWASDTESRSDLVDRLFPKAANQKNSTDLVVHWATRALAELEPPESSAGPTLAARLTSSNVNIRGWAAYGLGRIASKAAPQLSALRKARQTETDQNNRNVMDEAIAKITK